MSAGDMMALQFSFLAACMDIRTERFSNQGAVIFWAAGLFYRLQMQGSRGFWYFLAGATVPILILWVLFVFRMLGAGDIKLLSSLGGILGVKTILSCILISFIFGAVLSAAVLLLCGNGRERLRYFTDYLTKSITEQRILPYYRTGKRPENIHFTVPVFLAVLLHIGGFY